MKRNNGTSNEFSYCPYDGQRLKKPAGHSVSIGAKCPLCGFIDYQNPKPCIGVILRFEDRILLARRGEEPMKGCLDLPGGFVESGETVESAVMREIAEETGLRIIPAPLACRTHVMRPGQFRYLASFADEYGPRRVPTENLIFVAESQTGLVRPASDVAALEWFPIDRVPSDLAFPHQRLAIRQYLEYVRACTGSTEESANDVVPTSIRES